MDMVATMKMRVKCVVAPLGYERIQGAVGLLEPRDLPWLGYVFTSGGRPCAVNEVNEWKFEKWEEASFPPEGATKPSAADPIIEVARDMPIEPTTEHRRSRDQYDANRFVNDLDQAINYVRSVASEEYASMVHQPHLSPGCSIQSATYEVCATLVLRSLGAHFTGTLSLLLAKARDMLIAKNLAYGDSALNPLRVFSTASLKEQLLVRLDDKVSRLARGSAAGEDVAHDMLGYLLLVAIAEKREREQQP